MPPTDPSRDQLPHCLLGFARDTRLPTVLLAFLMFCPNTGATQDRVIAHEFFTYHENTSFTSDTQDDRSLPEPGRVAMSQSEAQGWPVFTSNGPLFPMSSETQAPPGGANAPPAHDDAVELDRETEREGVLQYHAVFDPSIAPFKRMGARDAVSRRDGQISIGLREGETIEVPVGGEARPDEEVFVGRLITRARRGVAIPLPSVAPDMRILAVDTYPPIPVTFHLDPSGNYTATLPYDGDVEVELVVAAPQTYFGGPLPPGSPRGRPQIDDDTILLEAGTVLRAARIDPEMTDIEALVALVHYFRAFEARDFPVADQSESIYLDIALTQIGVCRHRSQAFVITSNAAGIPARYVYNEAHAFVEVYIASSGWRRIDLGGASEGLEVHSPQPQSPHAPGEDPFPRPPNFEEPQITNATATGAADTRDADPSTSTQDATSGGHDSRTESASSDDIDAGADRHDDTTDVQRAAPDPADATADPSDEHADTQHHQEPPTTATLNELPRPDQAHAAHHEPQSHLDPDALGDASALTTTVLTLSAADNRAYRGSTLDIGGTLTNSRGDPVPAAPIHIYIGPASNDRFDAPVRLLGSVSTNAAGEFELALRIPQTIAVGRWGLYAVYQGDDTYAPTRNAD